MCDGSTLALGTTSIFQTVWFYKDDSIPTTDIYIFRFLGFPGNPYDYEIDNIDLRSLTLTDV